MGSASEPLSERRRLAGHAYYCERVRPFWDHVGEWTARIEPKQLVLLDVGSSVLGREACGVSRGLSCSLNGDLDDANEVII